MFTILSILRSILTSSQYITLPQVFYPLSYNRFPYFFSLVHLRNTTFFNSYPRVSVVLIASYAVVLVTTLISPGRPHGMESEPTVYVLYLVYIVKTKLCETQTTLTNSNYVHNT